MGLCVHISGQLFLQVNFLRLHFLWWGAWVSDSDTDVTVKSATVSAHHIRIYI